MQAAATMGTGVAEAGEQGATLQSLGKAQGAALHPEKPTLPPPPSAGAWKAHSLCKSDSSLEIKFYFSSLI